jgi:hypothetical protein
MCQYGNNIDVNVLIDKSLSHTGESRWCIKQIDSCIAPIVDALQKANINMLGSCCGHNKEDGSILLADGREIIIKGSLSGI